MTNPENPVDAMVLKEVRLTDEQCDYFRRLPCKFNDMVRAIHDAGWSSALAAIREGHVVVPHSLWLEAARLIEGSIYMSAGTLEYARRVKKWLEAANDMTEPKGAGEAWDE